MSLDPNDPRITAYVLDELDDEQRAAFESDLAGSDQLQNLVDETQRTVRQLSDELKSEPEMVMSDAHRKTVSDEIARAAAPTAAPATDAATRTAPPRFDGRKLAAVAALAATVLMACGAAYWLGARQQGNRASEVAQAEFAMQERETALREATTRLHALEEQRERALEVERRSKQLRAELVAESAASAGTPVVEVKEVVQPPASATPYEALSRLSDDQRPQVTREKLAGRRALPSPTATTPSSSGRRSLAFSPDGGVVAGGGDQSGQAAEVNGMGVMGGMGRGGYAEEGYGGGYPAPSGQGYGDDIAGGYESRGTGDAGPSTADPYGASGGEYGSGYGMVAGAPAATEPAALVPAGTVPATEGQYGGYRGEYARSHLGSTLYESVRSDVRSVQPSRLPGYDTDLGIGPGFRGDQHAPIVENPFKDTSDNLRSTFSIDVDTASYAKVRMYLMQQGAMPRPDAVRIEELINYFTYDYAPPEDEVPFAAHIEVADCPWAPAHRLVRFGIKGREMDREERPTSNLVFLLDVSGSMNRPNKLPLVKYGMKMLVDQLGENDSVAMVVYAGAAGLVLDSTTGDQKQLILDALDRLHAGGSTNGGEGIQLAYQMARDNFVDGGVNRVILCTDGDFNVGVTGTDELVRLAEENAKSNIFLSVLGFGMGNHNDSMLEQISNKGNGNYAFIDSEAEARKVLVEQMTGTLVTIAKDVKIQVQFNPLEVAAYRLIGYENRIMAAEDFNDDTKDAGEIGAGHTVTALYEVVPADVETAVTAPPMEELRYWTVGKPSKTAKSGEMLMLQIRYKQPDGDQSSLLTFPVKDEDKKFGQATKDFRFASAVASFGMLLRDSQYKGDATYAGVLETATEAASDDTSGYREEFLKMVERAKQISGE